MMIFYEKDIDDEFLAQLIGLSYISLYEICEQKNCTPYELYTAMKNEYNRLKTGWDIEKALTTKISEVENES